MGRHARYTPIPEYQATHVAAAGTLVPVGSCVSTTGSGAIVAGTNVPITPASMVNIQVGMLINLSNGSGTHEDVQVLKVTATTFTANVVNSYSSGFTIISRRGTFLSSVVINNPGTGCTITLYNGHPSLAPDAGQVIAVISPGTDDKVYGAALDKGLFYTVAGTTIGDYTICSLDMAA
jgi:hypothetical protein